MSAIAATGAQRIIVTHGSIPVMVKWLCQQGLDAAGFDTEYGDDDDDVGIAPQPATEAEQAVEKQETNDA
jgi:putative mRNA 3-end processing factor